MEKIKFHTTLSNYFTAQPLFFDGDLQKKPHIRKCVEQPFQQTKAQLWDEVTDTLCNLDFIQAKAVAKLTYELVKDFNDVLVVTTDDAENIELEKVRQARMDKYTKDLIAYAKGEIPILDIPESNTPWQKGKIDDTIYRIKTSPTKIDRLKGFSIFLGNEFNKIHNYAKEFPDLTIQQAWNFNLDGPVGKAAEEKSPTVLGKLLLRKAPMRPIWNPLPQMIKILEGHGNNTIAVCLTPNGRQAVSLGRFSSNLVLWDITKGQPLKVDYKGTDDMCMTPDCRFVVTGSFDFGPILWDMKTGQIVKIIGECAEGAHKVSISPDGKIGLAASKEYSLVLWDLETGKRLKVLKGHENDIKAVSLFPNSRFAISCSYDKTIILWDLENGIALKILSGHWSFVNAICVTPDGRYAISGSGDHNLILWDLETGQALKTLKGHTSGVNAVSMTPDGRYAISGSRDHNLILWDLETGQKVKILKGHLKEVLSVNITPDCRFAISGSVGNKIIVWNLESGVNNDESKIMYSLWNNAIRVTPDKSKALSGFRGNKGYQLIIWDLNTGQSCNILNGHTDEILDISISQDGQFAVTASRDETLILWDLSKCQAIITIRENTGRIYEVKITPDGQKAISYSSGGKTYLTIWDLPKAEVHQVLIGQAENVTGLLITPDGRYALTKLQDKTLILWDLETEQDVTTLKGHKNHILSMCVTPHGYYAISGSSDGNIILWNLKTGQVLKTLVGHHSEVVKVVIFPDGRKAISGSERGVLIMWDLETGLRIKSLNGHHGRIVEVKITPDGKCAASCSKDGSIIIWDIEKGEKLACFLGDIEINAMEIFTDGIIFSNVWAQIEVLNIDKKILCPNPGIVSARYIWDFRKKKYLYLSGDCSFCGARFRPANHIIKAIYDIRKMNSHTQGDLTYFKLPQAAWDDTRLLINCPKCGGELKFNPFIAGGDN